MNPITNVTATSASLPARASSSFNSETPDYGFLLMSIDEYCIRSTGWRIITKTLPEAQGWRVLREVKQLHLS
jgi:hypothetical protein